MSTKPPKPATSEDEVDAVLEKIDKCLPKIHERAESVKKGDTPTGGFRPDKIKQTKMAFQAMSEEAVLSDSNERSLAEAQAEAEAAERKRATNGAAKKPPKRTMFFRGGG